MSSLSWACVGLNTLRSGSTFGRILFSTISNLFLVGYDGVNITTPVNLLICRIFLICLLVDQPRFVKLQRISGLIMTLSFVSGRYGVQTVVSFGLSMFMHKSKWLSMNAEQKEDFLVRKREIVNGFSNSRNFKRNMWANNELTPDVKWFDLNAFGWTFELFFSNRGMSLFLENKI